MSAVTSVASAASDDTADPDAVTDGSDLAGTAVDGDAASGGGDVALTLSSTDSRPRSLPAADPVLPSESRATSGTADGGRSISSNVECLRGMVAVDAGEMGETGETRIPSSGSRTPTPTVVVS